MRTASVRGGGVVLLSLVGVAFTYAAFEFNGRWGVSTADKVAVAVEAYRTETGQYPADLEALVPVYLSDVPRACWRVALCEFSYFLYSDQDDAVLMWTKLPPFGRPTYRFKTKDYGYLD